MELGRAGVGVFAAPSILERHIRTRYGARVIGALPEVRQQFFAITAARRISHPTILAFIQAMLDRSLRMMSAQAASAR